MLGPKSELIELLDSASQVHSSGVTYMGMLSPKDARKALFLRAQRRDYTEEYKAEARLYAGICWYVGLNIEKNEKLGKQQVIKAAEILGQKKFEAIVNGLGKSGLSARAVADSLYVIKQCAIKWLEPTPPRESMAVRDAVAAAAPRGESKADGRATFG